MKIAQPPLLEKEEEEKVFIPSPRVLHSRSFRSRRGIKKVGGNYNVKLGATGISSALDLLLPKDAEGNAVIPTIKMEHSLSMNTIIQLSAGLSLAAIISGYVINSIKQ
jgi:hypothetical protein